MKLNDAVWGALLLLLGGALLLHVQGFPGMPGQKVGPALFPGLLGVGFMACGLMLALRGWRAGTTGPQGAAWVERPGWSGLPRQSLAFAVLVAVNAFYLLAAERLGFVPTGFLYLAALMWVLRVPAVRIVPIALVVTLLIHFCFYKLLRVPLPWGVLQPVAW